MEKDISTTIREELEAARFEELWADVNLEYGGMFIREGDKLGDVAEYYDVITITDLASACGADGQIMVESRNTSYSYARGNALKSAVNCCGGVESLKATARIDKRAARLMLAGWLVEYGISDPNGYGDGAFIATLDYDAEENASESWSSNVEGEGDAAFLKAIQEAIGTA